MKTDDNQNKILTFHHHEFEHDVREILGKHEGDITASDVSAITKLDCSNYSFMEEDIPTLLEFSNLESLDIDCYSRNLSFISSFQRLKYLYLCCYMREGVDCSLFAELKELRTLAISGGDISSMDIVNTEALTGLTNLQIIFFHEFGSTDLIFLEKMPWLEEFSCLYPDEVKNIESIGSLHNLKSLNLAIWSFPVESLSFLDSLPGEMELELGIDAVNEKYDIEKLKRFKSCFLQPQNTESCRIKM